MPLTIDTDNPDSLQTLLCKFNAISTINQENLTYIQSCKGQQVIMHQQCDLQTDLSPAKKLKTNHHIQTAKSNDNDSLNSNLLKFAHNTSTKNIDDIIASWRYKGETLTKEKIAFDDFIDLKLKDYNDLIGLHGAYNNLLEKYSLVLSDERESRKAIDVLLCNMEVLQVAIGEIHMQTIDVVYTAKMKQSIQS